MRGFESLPNAEGDRKHEIPKDIEHIYVLFHGEPYSENGLTQDARLRGLAALELKKLNPNAKIYLVGGGIVEGEGSATSGSEELFDYISKKDPGVSSDIVVLGKSNNTAGNISEIMDYQIKQEESKSQGGVVIISNEYHLKRIEELQKILGVEGHTFPAEDLVQDRSKHHKKYIETYQHSLVYKKQEVIDKLMFVYLKLDPNQKWVDKWRSRQRGFQHQRSEKGEEE
jgi:hypothetical protein